jgi:hypothetical protein
MKKRLNLDADTKKFLASRKELSKILAEEIQISKELMSMTEMKARLFSPIHV